MIRWLLGTLKPYSIRSAGRESVRYADELGRVVSVTVTRHRSDTRVLWIDDTDLNVWEEPNGVSLTEDERKLVVERVAKRLGPRSKCVSEFSGDAREFARVSQAPDAINQLRS